MNPLHVGIVYVVNDVEIDCHFQIGFSSAKVTPSFPSKVDGVFPNAEHCKKRWQTVANVAVASVAMYSLYKVLCSFVGRVRAAL